MKASRRKHTGFTLVELMAVLGILVLLGTVAVVAVTRIQASGERKIAQALVNSATTAVKAYRTAMRRFPADGDENGLNDLITEPDDEAQKEMWLAGGGPYFDDRQIPKDPWGFYLKYKATQMNGDLVEEFVVYSVGPNGLDEDGSNDDIPNWAESE